MTLEDLTKRGDCGHRDETKHHDYCKLYDRQCVHQSSWKMPYVNDKMSNVGGRAYMCYKVRR